MVNLRLSVRAMYKAGIKEHPQELVERLGIEYKRCEPIPVADCWLLFDCKGSIPVEYHCLFSKFNH